MAERTASLVIKLKDMASDGLKKFGTSLGGLKSAFFAATAAVAAFVAVGASALKEYAKQEEAVSKLENALRNQGLAVAATSQHLQSFAAELQKTTTFADEDIVSIQALLTTFGLAGAELDKTTKAAMDLSVGLGVDLKSAAMLLGKAAAGETATLGRYGIQISDTIPEAQKFAAVLDVVNQRFGGSAQAAALTVTGRIEVLKNRVGELKEAMGAQLLPVFEQVTGFLAFLVGKLEVVSSAISNTGSAWTVLQMAMLEGSKFLLEAFLSTFQPLFVMLEKLGFDMDSVTLQIEEAIDRQIAKVNQQAVAHQAAIAKRTAGETAFLTSTKATTDQRQAFLDRKAAEEKDKKDQFYADMLEKMHKAMDEETAAKIKQAEFEEAVNARRVQNLQSTFSFISSLSTAHNKGLAAIGKAAAISTATMDTFAAANKALASAPPPFNFGLAAAVTAAGIANVARIGGVQLAEGGIVMPRPGGVQATIGEAGSAEAVIPLDDERAQGMLGGGETHLHFHGPVIADKMSIREFARTLDKEFFSLQRNRMSVSGA